MKLLHTRKHLFTGGLVVAYLLVGSNHYLQKADKPDARHEAVTFASTIPRKVYQYSVVPGGVYTPEELAMARRNDPVVAAHFADFGKNTRITTLKEDMYVYVSYRKGDQILYTKKKHKVCKGEVVITDGKNYARARCANRITPIFRPPSQAFDEPTPPQFDYIDSPPPANASPADPVLTSNYYGLPQFPPYAAPPVTSGATPGPPTPARPFSGEAIGPQLLPFAGAAPALYLPPNSPTPTPIPVVVPEPVAWPFAVASGGILLLICARKRNSIFFGRKWRAA